jgi:hypothetical protein
MRQKFLALWRDKLIAHWDKKPFKDYLATFTDSEIELWRRHMPPAGPNVNNVCRASCEVLYWHSRETDDESESQLSSSQLREARMAIQLLYESVLFGFLVEQGIEPLSLMQEIPPDEET